MTRTARLAVIGILALSAVLAMLTSSITSPRSAPDERHHYSYAQYVARNPLDFPPHYERIRTDTADSANHLIHPPLYYQLMAIPYRLAGVDGQLTATGREADRHGAVSSSTAIPVLRSASVLLFLVHLVGFYLLVDRLVTTRVLPGWGAVLAAACLNLVPGFLYVAGTLNNDTLALAVWPFLALVTVRCLQDGTARDLWRAVLLTGLTILTKATLWPLVVVVAAAVAARLVLDLRAQEDGWLPALRARLRPAGVGWLTAGIAVLVVLAAASHLGANVVRYGAPQPHYLDVYNIPAEESRFYAWDDPATPRVGLVGVTGLVFEQSGKSLFGVLGQHERFYPAHPSRLFLVLGVITLLTVAVAGWRLRRRLTADPRIRLPVGMLAASLVFLVFLVQANHDLYQRYGYVGAQGRYFIGYLDLWLIGVIALLWSSAATLEDHGRAARTAAQTSVVGIAVLLAVVFVRPLFFFDRTAELHMRADVPQLIAEEAREAGMQRLELKAEAPDSFAEAGYVEESDTLPAPHFLMAWEGSTLTAPLPPGVRTGCLDLLVYARGDRAWGESTRLEVDTGDEGRRPLARLELPPRIETVRTVVNVPTDGGSQELVLRHANERAPGPPLVGRLWPRQRTIVLFGAHARWTACN